MTRLCWLVFFGKLKPENESVHEAPFVMTGPIALLGILTLVFGFTAPDWLDNVLGLPGEATGFGSFVLDKADSFHEHVVLAAVSSVVALVGIVLGLAHLPAGDVAAGGCGTRAGARAQVSGK